MKSKLSRHSADKRHRPLSQTGLIRIPQNAKQRVSGEGGHKPAGKVLDGFNDKQEGDRTLHPTKGWRTISIKRARAQMVVAEIRSGRPVGMAQAGRFIRHGW